MGENIPGAEAQSGPELQPGLNALPFPDLFDRLESGERVSISPDEADQRLHVFLASLNENGIDMVGIVTTQVSYEGPPGPWQVIEDVDRSYAIVRNSDTTKPSQPNTSESGQI